MISFRLAVTTRYVSRIVVANLCPESLGDPMNRRPQ